jgi:glycosyltransferase involved in cell wall biosynthesis
MICQSNGHPLVSVVIPAYNAQGFVGATLHSLVNQSYPHLEIIVVDDGSTDNTAQIVMGWKKRDHRIRLLQQPNAGVAAARNLAIRSSRGSFIAPVDADDVCQPDKISKLMTALNLAGDDFGLAYSWSYTIDQYGNMLGKGTEFEYEGSVYLPYLFFNFIGNASATLIRKKCFETVGMFDINFFHQKAQGCEDYDLFLRISEQFKFKLVKEFLTGYRITPNSMSTNYKKMEKSRSLVTNSQKAKHPWIPDVILNWSSAYYYLWLSGLARDRRAYHDSIMYLIKAALKDPIFLITPYYFKIYLAHMFKWVFDNNLNNNKDYKNQITKTQVTNRKINLVKYWLRNVTLSQKQTRMKMLKEKRLASAHLLFRQCLMKSCHDKLKIGLNVHDLN